MDGMLFRGTQDVRVLAIDFKTGKQLWDTLIGDTKHGEKLPSAPIAWDGLVYIGNARGDFKGANGHIYALEGKTDKIVWDFHLTPKTADDALHGPVGTSPLDGSTWNNAPGIPITGAGAWTSYTLDIKNGLVCIPGGDPGPGFGSGAREGNNLFVDSVVVLDAKTGNYMNHFQIVNKDWYDFDVSNPLILLQSIGGIIHRKLICPLPAIF
jgi:alcohol dehydrogenase (cytochrome c)